jgi:hypothetical protein
MDEGINLKNLMTKIFIFLIIFILIGYPTYEYLIKNKEDSHNFGDLKISKDPDGNYTLNATSDTKILIINQNSEWVGTINFKQFWIDQNL